MQRWVWPWEKSVLCGVIDVVMDYTLSLVAQEGRSSLES